MNRKIKMIAVVMALVMLLAGIVALAEGGKISTSVLMRVSRMTQSAVANVGEDLTMEVNVGGVEPAAYQWYFGDQAIENANQKVYTIVDASVEDSGVYRMDAFDANGRMLVSMDISARVIDPDIPKAGDNSMTAGAAVMLFAGAALVLAFTFRRRKEA